MENKYKTPKCKTDLLLGKGTRRCSLRAQLHSKVLGSLCLLLHLTKQKLTEKQI